MPQSLFVILFPRLCFVLMTDPVPVCCALIEANGRVLVAKRPANKHLAGMWEFPGGKVEPTESPKAALVREIKEELGCEIEITDSLPAVVHSYPRAVIRLSPFLAKVCAGSPAPHPHEHVAIKWLTPAELAKAELAPADMPIIPAYLQRFA